MINVFIVYSRSSCVPSLFVSEHTQVTANPRDPGTLEMIREFKKEIGKGIEFKKFVAKARSSLGKLLADSSKTTPNLKTVILKKNIYITKKGFKPFLSGNNTQRP